MVSLSHNVVVICICATQQQPNPNSTVVGFDMKMTVHTTLHKLNVSNISAVIDPILIKTLKVASWEHLEQIPTVTVTFVPATFLLATIVHIRNILAVTGPILMKLKW